MSLQSFPHLTNDEFYQACCILVNNFRQHGHEQVDWLSAETARDNDTNYVTIIKELCRKHDDIQSEIEVELGEVEEEDDESLDPPTKPTTLVQYDILLSPVYRVPVLYFSITDPQHRFAPTMDTLYEHIIAAPFKAQVENTGIIGGITVNDHPITNKPVFFIHPCRTAEMMQASVGKRSISATDYLMIWIGALGQSVGLNVPLALVRRDKGV